MLEVTLVCIIMLGTVIFVGSIDSPPPADSILYNSNSRKARDALLVAQDLPLWGRCNEENRLEQLIVDGVRGTPSGWEEFKERHFGDPLDVGLVLENGYGVLPLHGPANLLGSTANVHLLTAPSYNEPVVALSTYSGSEALVAAHPAVSNSKLVRTVGEAVRVELSAENGTASREFVVYAPTAVIREGSEDPRPATALYARSERGPAFIVEPNVQVLGGSEPLVLRFEVNNGQHEGALQILDGTELVIDYPASWTFESDDTHAGWNIEESPAGGRLIARLASSVSSAEITPRFVLSGAPDRPFDVVRAHLRNGALGESSVVVSYAAAESVDRSFPRTLHPTVPYPLRAGSSAVWGVALANGGPEMTVTTVDIEIPGGYDLAHYDGEGAPIFDEDAGALEADPRVTVAEPPELAGDAAGTWEVLSPTLVRWRGARPVAQGQAEYWAVQLTVRDDPTLETAIEPVGSDGPTASVSFENGFTLSGSQWGHSPGIISLAVPPESLAGGDGYPTDVQVHDFTTRVSGAFASLEGEGEYRALATGSDLTNVQSALSESYIEVADRVVELGEIARVDAYLDSVVTALADAGVGQATITTEVYAPITRGCPTLSRTSPLSTLVGVRVEDVLVWDGGTPTESMYLGDADGFVYRLEAGVLDAQLPPLMEAYLGSPVRELERGERDGEPVLLAGLDDGRVLALDPVTGDLEGTLLTGVKAVEALVFNETSGRFLAVSGGGITLAGMDGAIIREVELERSVLQIEQVASGDVYVLTSTQLLRYDAELRELASANVSGMIGFAVGESALLAHAGGYVAHDRATLAVQDDYLLPGIVPRLAAHAEMTGDGVPDLVLGAEGNVVALVDGASFGPRADVVAYTQGTLSTAPFPIMQGPGLDCAPASQPMTYVNGLHCGNHAAAGGPTMLRARDGAVAFAYEQGGAGYVALFGPWLAERAVEPLPEEDAISALALGTWGGEDAFAVGTMAGHGRTVGADGETRSAGTPSGAAGVTTFQVPIPEGGFLGSHLVVVRIEWTEGLKTQSASLYDWFEVVPPLGDGTAAPLYRVALVVSDRSDPMG